MEIRVQSIKFDADKKLLDYVEKKLSKLSKFHDGITQVNVTLSLLADPDNKNVKINVSVPGNNIVVEKNGWKFEEAIVDCVEILKERLVKDKEKKIE